MQDFLNKKLREKIINFISPKTDKEVADIVVWFTYKGVNTNPEEWGVSKEDAQYIAEEILGSDTFINLVEDLKGETTQLFRRSSISDREIVNAVHSILGDVVFNRFYNNSRKKK